MYLKAPPINIRLAAELPLCLSVHLFGLKYLKNCWMDNFMQTFMVPGWWNLLTLMILWSFCSPTSTLTPLVSLKMSQHWMDCHDVNIVTLKLWEQWKDISVCGGQMHVDLRTSWVSCSIGRFIHLSSIHPSHLSCLGCQGLEPCWSLVGYTDRHLKVNVGDILDNLTCHM